MSAAYLTRVKGKFHVQLLLPEITDAEDLLAPGDSLFNKVPFTDLKEGWWLDDGTFLGLRPDVFFNSNGDPITL